MTAPALFTTRGPLARLRADLDWITTTWDLLTETRLKGTRRPWRQTELTPERRAELDAQARAERRARADALGEAPAPLHLDVLDLTLDTTRDLAALATRLARTIADAVPLPALAAAPARLDAEQIASYISTRAHHLDEPEQAELADQIRGLRHRIAAQFTEVVDGQRLHADCPWCHQPRLKFRTIGPEHSPDVVVRCESGVCNPSPADCGTWHRGLPVWPFHEWDWLAGRINHEAGDTPTASTSN